MKIINDLLTEFTLESKNIDTEDMLNDLKIKFLGKKGLVNKLMQNLKNLPNDEKKVLNDYLYHFYGACDWNSSKGATISRLYNDNLKKIIIPFPKSLEEQKQIVSKFDNLSSETKKLEQIYNQKLQDLEELKKSILQKAFNGELT